VSLILEKGPNELTTALALETREQLALVGGGGKTSLMFVLAEALNRTGKRVVTTTTTKIWHREARNSPCIIFIQSNPSWRHKLKERLQTQGHVFLARSLLDSGKVEGISPSLANEIYKDQRIDYLIVEADGAAGHPVKAPAEHEPAIPASATKVVAMLGLEAMGQQMEPEIVFRIDLFSKMTGLSPGQKLTPAVLSGLFLDPKGLFKKAPNSAKRIVFLNKLDLLTTDQEAKDLAYMILGNALKQIDRVVIGSIMKGTYLLMGRDDERYLCQDR